MKYFGYLKDKEDALPKLKEALNLLVEDEVIKAKERNVVLDLAGRVIKHFKDISNNNPKSADWTVNPIIQLEEHITAKRDTCGDMRVHLTFTNKLEVDKPEHLRKKVILIIETKYDYYMRTVTIVDGRHLQTETWEHNGSDVAFYIAALLRHSNI